MSPTASTAGLLPYGKHSADNEVPRGENQRLNPPSGHAVGDAGGQASRQGVAGAAEHPLATDRITKNSIPTSFIAVKSSIQACFDRAAVELSSATNMPDKCGTVIRAVDGIVAAGVDASVVAELCGCSASSAVYIQGRDDPPGRMDENSELIIICLFV